MYTRGYNDASIKSTVENKTKHFPIQFQFSTSWFLFLAEAFRNGHVAAYTTALRSATEENESGGYVTFTCPSKVTEHSRTADWLNF